MPAPDKDRQGSLDRFGAQEADDDAHPRRHEAACRRGTPFAAAGVVGHFERRGAAFLDGGQSPGTDLLAEDRRRAGERRGDPDERLRERFPGQQQTGGQDKRSHRRSHGEEDVLSAGPKLPAYSGQLVKAGCPERNLRSERGRRGAFACSACFPVIYNGRSFTDGKSRRADEERHRAADISRRDGAFRRGRSRRGHRRLAAEARRDRHRGLLGFGFAADRARVPQPRKSPQRCLPGQRQLLAEHAGGEPEAACRRRFPARPALAWRNASRWPTGTASRAARRRCRRAVGVRLRDRRHTRIWPPTASFSAR